LNKKKTHIKHLIATLLVITVLLPVTIQFVHALKKHEYATSVKKLTITTKKNITNCSVFHYQIDHSTIDFSSKFIILINERIEEKIHSIEVQSTSIKLQYKSSRAPPVFIV
jgi:hypothetical protein